MTWNSFYMSMAGAIGMVVGALVMTALPRDACGQTPAMVPVVCYPPGQVEGILSGYGEEPVATGITGGGGAVVVMWASPGGGWAVTLRKSGAEQVCVVAFGTDAEVRALPATGNGA